MFRRLKQASVKILGSQGCCRLPNPLAQLHQIRFSRSYTANQTLPPVYTCLVSMRPFAGIVLATLTKHSPAAPGRESHHQTRG